VRFSKIPADRPSLSARRGELGLIAERQTERKRRVIPPARPGCPFGFNLQPAPQPV
jgi:hypothetical protein